MADDFEYPGGDLVSRDVRDAIEPAVLTLAEIYFEAGFSQERSLDMAWHLALLPELIRADGGDPW
jgi:hypothetical protein